MTKLENRLDRGLPLILQIRIGGGDVDFAEASSHLNIDLLNNFHRLSRNGFVAFDGQGLEAIGTRRLEPA